MIPSRAIVFGLVLLAFPATAQDDMGSLYKRAMELYRKRDYQGALPRFEEALKLAEERYGKSSPLLSLELNNLGEVYRALGRYEAAEPLFKRAIALDEETRDREDDPGLATSLNNLALVYREQERFKEAEPLYKRSLALLERMLGAGHPDVAKSLNNLAMLYREEGRPDDARPLLQRAIRVAENALGPEHQTTLRLQENLLRLSGPQDGVRALASRPSAPPPTKQARSQVAPAAGPVAIPKPRPRAILVAQARAPKAVRNSPPPAKAAPSAPAPAAAPARSGGFAVHVASIRAAGDIPGEWRQLTADYPQLERLELEPPQAIVLPGKGVFYRLAAGPLPDRGAASRLCEDLHSMGQFCSVIAR
jgi:tetratricopeptide (TPR) repeat protein